MSDVFWNAQTPSVAPGPTAYVPVRVQGAAPDGSQDTFAQIPLSAALVTGASAYDIWLAAGNTGSEADFLASLKGSGSGSGGASGEWSA